MSQNVQRPHRKTSRPDRQYQSDQRHLARLGGATDISCALDRKSPRPLRTLSRHGLARPTYRYTVIATNNLQEFRRVRVVLRDHVARNQRDQFVGVLTLMKEPGTIANDYPGIRYRAPCLPRWRASGIINGALSFDGESTQVSVTNAASLNPVQNITIAAWVNASFWFNTPRIIEKGKTDNQYALFVNGSGSLEFLLTGVTGGNLSITPPSAGVWHHVAGTYDGSLISLYVDGQLAAQQSASGPLAITTDPLAIGDKPSGSVLTSFAGTIDDVRLYGAPSPQSDRQDL